MFISGIFFSLLLFGFCDTNKAERDYFSSSSASELKSDYVDPHSFHYDKHAKQERKFNSIEKFVSSKDGESDDENCSHIREELHGCQLLLRNRPKSTDIGDELLSRRLIGILLSKANLKKQDDVSIGILELEISDAELDTLKAFGEGKIKLREIDPILIRIIKSSSNGYILESAVSIYNIGLSIYFSYLNAVMLAVEHKENIACLLIFLSMAYNVQKMKRKKGIPIWISVSSILMLLFVFSFFITWWKLLQEAEIDHVTLQMENSQMPVHCFPEKMSYWDKFVTWFSSKDDCRKYHEAKMKTPFFQVTPLQALSHMLSYTIAEPIVICGKAFSMFLKNFTEHMSFIERVVVLTITSLTLVPMLIFGLILLCGGSLSFGPFSFLKFKGPTRSTENQRLEGKAPRQPVEVYLNVNVNNTTNESPASRTAVTYSHSTRSLTYKPQVETPVTEEACVSKETETKNEKNGSGDCNSNSDASNSESESFEEISQTEVNVRKEDGSGDCGVR